MERRRTKDMALKVDPMRVVRDPKYAASLSDAHWHALAADPVWDEMVGEHQEMVAPVLTLYAQQLNMAAPRPVTPSPPAAEVPEQFDVIGKRVPRLHGLGVVTSLGQYTQNMRMPGMLHTRTLRSPHPHARIKSLDTSRAERLAGVVAVLHRGNLPEEYRDVTVGS